MQSKWQPKTKKKRVTYYPAWIPRWDMGHWNERWGTKLPEKLSGSTPMNRGGLC